jgi:sensor histidine kinase regulating citrate/malate metabolism
VNALVTYHFSQAEEKGIHCAATLFVPERLGLPADELSIILGNALENAVKGAETMEDTGYVEFSARPVNDCVVFDIENNHRPGAYRKGADVGLTSIRNLCEKNDGRANATDADGTFRLNIVLRLG